jgi:hypothetical protein
LRRRRTSKIAKIIEATKSRNKRDDIQTKAVALWGNNELENLYKRTGKIKV